MKTTQSAIDSLRELNSKLTSQIVELRKEKDSLIDKNAELLAKESVLKRNEGSKEGGKQIGGREGGGKEGGGGKESRKEEKKRREYKRNNN
ncbi:hypothetical protein Glove_120g199 [Diversispora epigaea]|uniref:Uncharacterized protein n=1 Tax=Diversispora epigaea TaxID=1348612 RepID=A0A397J5Z7_9GLOM|nr:hypothetical protein Glove_120g199 [Diversispora epigaea]